MRPNLSDVEVLRRETLDLWAYVADGRIVFDDKSRGRGQGVIQTDGARAFLIKRRRQPQPVEVRSFERLTVRARKIDRWVTFSVLRPLA